jgi:DNA-directed RNA polymerase III subunit RPC1
LRRTQICKKVNDQCRKTKTCYSCGSINGQVKKAGPHPLKLIHDRFKTFNSSNAAKKLPPVAKILFEKSLNDARKNNPEIDKHAKKAVDDLNPLRVLNLFKQITASDCELLGMNPAEGRPELFLWQYVPAPPVAIRPSVPQDGSSTEDDITVKLCDIVHINTLIKEGLKKGLPVQTILEQWDFLQVQIAMYINSDVPGLLPLGYQKTIRGFCQRLKGKQGRFRGNLSGKRVDFSGRTVISPDPNLSIEEVAVPELIAKNLTYPERVSRYNIAKLRARINNGANKWPGANYIIKEDQNIKQYLKYGKLSAHADHLQIGDIVERHLEDGDIVLFNRQPSLHKLSILSHYVKVRPHRTFRLNECVCNPYNADFDGDEMNLHVPQTEEARIEAIELMGVKHNLATPKNGEPIISAIQDFITGAYLLSSKDVFYDRKTFSNVCMYMVDGNAQLDLPPPAVLKPQMLWTGKQVFNVMMRPNKSCPNMVNLDAACREYRAVPGQPRDLDKNDGWLVIRNSEVMCGVMDKSTIGSGKKDSVFYVLLRDFGPDAAVQAMNRLAKLSARWLTNQGFSIGISDVYPGDNLVNLKMQLVERAYAQCDGIIEKFKLGKLDKAPGCDEEQTMENLISGILSKVRQQAGDHCIAELSRWNSPLIMATSGSKGSNINVSQMVAVVGQQIIGGKRVADGFQDRSLPHFPKNARQPPSKGFVQNSFFSGLSPTEFLFHAISGREGLVDTAVKTAETGYMSRRLMKSLEDLSTQYDHTVRNSSSNIVQFQYGDDKLDPVDMEGKAKPVHFERTFTHAEVSLGFSRCS